ncbi:MAG: hypothetical protein ABR596_09810, partial [Halarsenatibacteraceae bacterium]
MKKALLILVILSLTVFGQSRIGLAVSHETVAEAADQAEKTEATAEAGQGDSSESEVIEARPGYQTLKGKLYDIGIGEAPMLVFKAETGDYLVSVAGAGTAGSGGGEKTGADISQDAAENACNNAGIDTSGFASGVNQEKLSKLKGLPLLLTGRVSLFNGGSFSGQIKVRDYNTYYDNSRDGLSENTW